MCIKLTGQKTSCKRLAQNTRRSLCCPVFSNRHFSDRHHKGLVIAVTVAVVPILSLFSDPPLLAVAAVAFILASARCFFYPASKSAVADMLTDEAERQAGSSFLQASFQAASVAGLALGGIMIGMFSAPLMYLPPVSFYSISIILLLRISNLAAEADCTTSGPVW